MSEFQKMWKCAKIFSTTQNSENLSELSQKSHFRHVGFYYSGAEKSVPFCSLFAGEHFGVLFAPWPQMLMKPMVSASDFTLLGIKMRK